MYVRAYRASKISPWKLACFLMPSHLAQGNLTRPQCLSSVTPIHNLNDIFTVPHAVFQLTLLHFQHAEYCKLRAEQFFSPFTLQPAYILTMYLLRQAQVWEQTYSAYVSHWVALQSMPETLCCRCYSDIAGQRCWRSSSMRTGSGTQTQRHLPPKAKWLNSRQQPSTGVVGGSNPSVATHFRCWEGLGDGFGVVCHHPACTGAFPGCKLLPSKESPSVLGDGVIPFRGVV